MFFGFLKKFKKKTPTGERRMEPRYGADDEFLVEFEDRRSRYIGNSRDLSVHGLRFVTTAKLRVREKLVLNFRFPYEFPGLRQFNVRAQVIRIYRPAGTARYRIGCRLLHDSEQTKEAIRQFIFWLEN